jgi:thiol-disulfide isomerase/thioredoxin
MLIQIGQEAPVFAAKSLDGRDIVLTDLRGKVVFLDFWATWCGPCIAEIPNIKRALETYGEDGRFVVIGVSLDTDDAVVKAFAQSRGVSWPQIRLGPAEENAVAKLYNVSGVPATFLIGPDGKVAAKDLTGKALGRAVAKLIPPAAVASRQSTSDLPSPDEPQAD